MADGLPLAAGYGVIVLVAWVTRRLHRAGKSWATLPVLPAALVAVLLTWVDWQAWSALLAPDASGQGAAVFAILCLQAMVGGIALLMAGYLGWRALKGLLSERRNNTLDLTCLFLGYTGGQGLVGTLFVRAIGA